MSHYFGSTCGCHGVPVHSCPGKMPGNTAVQGPSIDCIGCPVVSSVLTDAQLAAGGNLAQGQLHWSSLSNSFSYLDMQGGSKIIATTADLLAIQASMPSAATINGWVNAALTNQAILDKIDCAALVAKCSLLTAANLGAYLVPVAGSGLTLTAGAGGVWALGYTAAGGASPTTLTAAQIKYAFDNVACADATAMVNRCNLCASSTAAGVEAKPVNATIMATNAQTWTMIASFSGTFNNAGPWYIGAPGATAASATTGIALTTSAGVGVSAGPYSTQAAAQAALATISNYTDSNGI